MKDIYQTPEMETVEFAPMDVITTSVGISTTAEWVPRENEGAPGGDGQIWASGWLL